MGGDWELLTGKVGFGSPHFSLSYSPPFVPVFRPCWWMRARFACLKVSLSYTGDRFCRARCPPLPPLPNLRGRQRRAKASSRRGAVFPTLKPLLIHNNIKIRGAGGAGGDVGEGGGHGVAGKSAAAAAIGIAGAAAGGAVDPQAAGHIGGGQAAQRV